MKSLGTAVLLILIGTVSAQAQISLTSVSPSYTQNFNSYAGTSLSLPANWTGAGLTFQGTGTGTSNSGGLYAFGSASEFSLGALRSGSNTGTYTVSFTNGGATNITSLTIGWNYEQWRFANTSGLNVTGTGTLSSNTTLNAKDFAGVASGTNGTVATTAVSSFVLSGLTIAPGASFGLSWATTDATSSDNGVAIDDFSLSATFAAAPVPEPSTAAALLGFTALAGAVGFRRRRRA